MKPLTLIVLFTSLLTQVIDPLSVKTEWKDKWQATNTSSELTIVNTEFHTRNTAGTAVQLGQSPVPPGVSPVVSAAQLQAIREEAHMRERYTASARAFKLCDIDHVNDPIDTTKNCLPHTPTKQTPTTKPQTPTTNYHHEITKTLATTKITPPTLTTQPPGNKALSLYPVIITTPTNTTHTTITIKNTPIPIHFQATHHTINWGDNTKPTTTTKPLTPYPNHPTSHTYKPGTYQITLTTTWTATWQHPTTKQHITQPHPLTTTQTTPIQIIHAQPTLIYTNNH